MLSEDGRHFLNLWFIPHYTELLLMYKAMSNADCKQALTHHLRIVASLHDIIQYLCAHAKLGSSQARLGSKKIDFVSADWGGSEGIGGCFVERIDYYNISPFLLFPLTKNYLEHVQDKQNIIFCSVKLIVFTVMMSACAMKVLE